MLWGVGGLHVSATSKEILGWGVGGLNNSSGNEKILGEGGLNIISLYRRMGRRGYGYFLDPTTPSKCSGKDLWKGNNNKAKYKNSQIHQAFFSPYPKGLG